MKERSYKIKEIFCSFQGEGIDTGKLAVFCRFAGCNLWSGKEDDRETAICKFCDTDFVGGTSYAEDDLVDAICNEWKKATLSNTGVPLVVFTGGEPGLQLTSSLINKMRKNNFDCSVETNGTIKLPDGVYHITVSPKAGITLLQTKGYEAKVIYPQEIDLKSIENMDFKYLYLQPMDGIDGALQATMDKIKANPLWRLSIQTHKVIGVR